MIHESRRYVLLAGNAKTYLNLISKFGLVDYIDLHVRFRTTKMCTTHVSGVGDCVDLSRDGDFCDDRDEMKVGHASFETLTMKLLPPMRT